MIKDEGARQLESRMGSDSLTEDTSGGKLRLGESKKDEREKTKAMLILRYTSTGYSCYVQILKESGHGQEWKVRGLGACPADSY